MTRSAARTTPPSELDLYRYGWRFVKKARPDGTTDLVQLPLTLEDVLHPQEDDVIPEHTLQERDEEYLRPIFRERAARLRGGFFLADCLVDWGVRGIRAHSPDLAVFRGLRAWPPENLGRFHLRASGGRCVLTAEIVSPHTHSNDVVHKVREYHAVQVPLYILIDQEREDGPRQVVGYRYTPSRYVRMKLDRQGRLLIKPLDLWLGLEDNRAVCYDGVSGERLGDYRQERNARLAAERRIQELEAELRRLRGTNASSP